MPADIPYRELGRTGVKVSAIGIGGSKGAFQRRAKQRRIDALTALKMQKKIVRGPGNRADLR